MDRNTTVFQVMPLRKWGARVIERDRWLIIGGFGDIFCRNGRTCRCKRVHREFRDALKGMYNRCTI